MSAYYNEIEPFAAGWLRNLSAAGHIAPGCVDGRSIKEVLPLELLGSQQCHFFAGIGVWSYALRLAGWPDWLPVWTGSCPCQPFSQAGRKGGFDDERHLWPEWFRLINECRPPIIFGEQVASKPGLAWFDAVSADLEGAGYSVGAADLCAAGVGAPHIRQRLYFVAVANNNKRLQRFSRTDGCGESLRMVDAGGPRSRGNPGAVSCAEREGENSRIKSGYLVDEPFSPGPTGGFWQDADWLPCSDEKARPVEPGTFPLAHGAPTRVGRLRGYGNAIVSEVAATFIQSVMDVL